MYMEMIHFDALEDYGRFKLLTNEYAKQYMKKFAINLCTFTVHVYVKLQS